MMSVTTSPGPIFASSDPHQLFANTMSIAAPAVVPFYDLTPDDRHFLMVRLASGSQAPGGGQMVVVDNWTTELFAKMRAH